MCLVLLVIIVRFGLPLDESGAAVLLDDMRQFVRVQGCAVPCPARSGPRRR